MIVVTGGLGFIGNELVRQLMRSGQEVLVIDNRNRVATDIADISGIRSENIDIIEYTKIKELFLDVRPEIVFHLAAIHFIPECNENPERTLRINVEGTQSVRTELNH
jgi:UDP-glucose 4-epimerase